MKPPMMKDREIANKILLDNMSDASAKHISEISYLQDWIIDAMLEYHNKKLSLSKEAGKEQEKCINTSCKNKATIPEGFCYHCSMGEAYL